MLAQRCDYPLHLGVTEAGSKTQGSRSRADHIRLDYEKLLRMGIRGLIDEIKEKKQALDLKNAARSFPNA